MSSTNPIEPGSSKEVDSNGINQARLSDQSSEAAAGESYGKSSGKSSGHGSGGLALHWKILAGLIIGVVLGGAARFLLPPGADGKPNYTLNMLATNVAEPMGQIFLRLIMMAVVPLVFTALSLAVVELGDLRKLGRMGAKNAIVDAAVFGCVGDHRFGADEYDPARFKDS